MCNRVSRRFWHTRTVALAALAGLALVGRVNAGMMTEWQEKQTIGNIDSDNYDLAIGGGKAHVAYQNGGNVYYTSRGVNESNWSAPKLIGAGMSPSIAVNGSGGAHVAYQNAGTIYESAAGNGWLPVSVGGGSYGSLGTSGNGTRHLLIEGNYDGDSYAEIGYSSNSGSGWSGIGVLHDGAYGDGSGNYFGQVSVAGAAGGGFVYAMESQAWGGRASWSAKYPSAIVPGGAGASMEVGWNTGSSLSRRAIAAGADGVGFAFSSGGAVYVNVMMEGEWVGFMAVGAGSGASVDMSNGLAVAYADGGSLMFYDGLLSTPIEVAGMGLMGTNPLLSGDGKDLFVLYRDGDGKLSLASTTIVPEPAGVWMVMVGAGAALLRRRRK